MNISALIWLMKYGNRLQQINTQIMHPSHTSYFMQLII